MNYSSEVDVKVVALSVIDGQLKVFLQNRRLPSTFPVASGSLDRDARHILSGLVNTKANQFFLEQLYTFSSDTAKKKNITVTYYILLPYTALSHSQKDSWWDPQSVDADEGDREIINYALKRLRWKLEYTNVVYSLLPKEFTLSELQNIYEAILDKPLDKRNFRKKILALKLVKKSGHMRKNLVARPARTYTFISNKPEIVKVFS